MRQLTATQVHELKVRELGLPSDALDLVTAEALAGALRRAATFLCPCTPLTLVNATVLPLRGLVTDIQQARVLVEQVLEALIAHGDILDLPEVDSSSFAAPSLLYVTPASFVTRRSGVVFLLGDMFRQLPSELESRIQHLEHTRRITPNGQENLSLELLQLGLQELTSDVWLKSPSTRVATEQLAKYDLALEAATVSTEIPGLTILDPRQSVRYYPGRWVEPTSERGRYVARRKRRFGADLWCYVQLVGGKPERMIDLPTPGFCWRGCDEAWHLQMAIDYQRNSPQCYRMNNTGSASVVLEFFSPLPSWARRRLNAMGEPVKSPGNLLAYRLPKIEVDEETHFLQNALWLVQDRA